MKRSPSSPRRLRTKVLLGFATLILVGSGLAVVTAGSANAASYQGGGGGQTCSKHVSYANSYVRRCWTPAQVSEHHRNHVNHVARQKRKALAAKAAAKKRAAAKARAARARAAQR